MTHPAADAMLEEVERIRETIVEREVTLARVIDRMTTRHLEKELPPPPEPPPNDDARDREEGSPIP